MKARLLLAATFALVSVACSSTVSSIVPHNGPLPTPGPSYCGPAAADTAYLRESDLADPAKVLAARMDLALHEFVVLCGGKPGEFADDLHVSNWGMTRVTHALIAGVSKASAPALRSRAANPTNPPPPPSPVPPYSLASTATGFYESRNGVINAFQSYVEDFAQESTSIGDWMTTWRCTAGTCPPFPAKPDSFPPPSIGAGWQPVFTNTLAADDPAKECVHDGPCRNVTTVVYGYWRLADHNPNYDWFMVTERVAGKPDWNTCNILGWNWWSNRYRFVNIESYEAPPGTTLYADGPPTTESSHSVTWGIGLQLSPYVIDGLSGSYSVSYNTNDVTIRNLTRGLHAQQEIRFSPPGIVCNPALTTISNYYSEHAAMFQLPERGSITIRPTNNPSVSYVLYTKLGAHDYGMTDAFFPFVTMDPPVFDVEPRKIVFHSGQTKTFIHIKAKSGPSNLGWTLSTRQYWLELGRTRGFGDADVSLEVTPDAPPGAFANLEVNTEPIGGANNVETGPLVVRVEREASPTPSPPPSPPPSPSPSPTSSPMPTHPPTPSPSPSPTVTPGGFYVYAKSLHPLAYYRLDATSGTAVDDSSGNGYTGKLAGSAKLGVPGLLAANSSKAIALTGGYVSLPPMHDYAAFTLITLARASNYATRALPLVGYRGNYLAVAQGKLKWCIELIAACVDSFSPTLTGGKAYIFAMTVSISSGTAQVACATNGAKLVDCNRNRRGGTDLLTGANFLGHAPFFNNVDGTLDEVLVYPYVLSGEQITRLATDAGY